MRKKTHKLTTSFQEFCDKLLYLRYLIGKTNEVLSPSIKNFEDSVNNLIKSKTKTQQKNMKEFCTLYAHIKDDNRWKSVFIGSYSSLYTRKPQELKEVLNRQYCWFLVEAYEIYADYLRDVYAVLGYIDYKLWFCEDFGEKQMHDVKSMQYNVFKDIVYRNRLFDRDIELIRKRLRIILPHLETKESEKVSELSLYKQCIMIEQFRHIIVHERGRVANIKDLLNNIGEHGNSKYSYVMNYFKALPTYMYLYLIDEKRTNDHTLMFLIDNLITNAVTIYKECATKFTLELPWNTIH